MALGDPRLLPPKYVEALTRWIKDGIPPGGFVRACLKNDFFDAIARANQTSLMIFDCLCGWLAKHAPAPCFGSLKNYEAWEKRGGMPNWNINYDTNDVPEKTG